MLWPAHVALGSPAQTSEGQRWNSLTPSSDPKRSSLYGAKPHIVLWLVDDQPDYRMRGSPSRRITLITLGKGTAAWKLPARCAEVPA